MEVWAGGHAVNELGSHNVEIGLNKVDVQNPVVGGVELIRRGFQVANGRG